MKIVRKRQKILKIDDRSNETESDRSKIVMWVMSVLIVSVKY